jgi:uncharacterized repeat protein (TIGR03803 family)
MLAAAPAAQATGAAAAFAVVYTAPSTAPLSPAVGAVDNGVIYGIDPARGAAGGGVLFTIAGGTYTPLFTFSGANGQTPNARLILDGTGGVIGTTRAGGSLGTGTVFRVSGTGQLLWSHSLQPATEGDVPLDGLAADALGNFYGTTSLGAIAPGNGVLFRVNKNGAFHVLYQFHSLADGHCPFTGVVVDQSDTIYGTTVGMGFGGQPLGSLWKRPYGGKPTTLYSFTDASTAGGALTDGEYPQVTPSFDSAGNLWGVTSDHDGATSAGAIWELTPTGARVLYNFTGGGDGYLPNGPLLLGLDGNFYGTTRGGGSAAGLSGNGVVYRFNPVGTAAQVAASVGVVHVFTGATDGATPTGSLALDPSGRIYGGTATGTIYQITP